MESMRETIAVLRAARVLAGMSQSDLAAAAALSRQKIVRMENGAGNVPLEVVEAVRVALERAGIVFNAGTKLQGTSIAMLRDRPRGTTETDDGWLRNRPTETCKTG
jgi:Predicted transcriptional regulators